MKDTKHLHQEGVSRELVASRDSVGISGSFFSEHSKAMSLIMYSRVYLGFADKLTNSDL